jgi:hypothetical protein
MPDGGHGGKIKIREKRPEGKKLIILDVTHNFSYILKQ